MRGLREEVLQLFENIVEHGDTRADAAAAELAGAYAHSHACQNELVARGKDTFCYTGVSGQQVVLEQDHKQLLGMGVTGSTVWDSSVVLSKFIEHNMDILQVKGSHVVELGSGCGLVSLATALMGANVVATDQAHMMPILERNIAANARPGMGPCKALELCWGSREGHGWQAKDLWGAWEEEEEEEEEEDGKCGGSPRHPDLVVAADCVYHPDVTALLIDTIDELSGQDTTVLVAVELRQHENLEHFLTEALLLFDVYRAKPESLHPGYAAPSHCTYLLKKRNGSSIPLACD